MTEVQKASLRMFGPGGMGVKNFSVFPGEKQVSAEVMAKAINDMLDSLEQGNFTEVKFDDKHLAR
jgi:hypothetical protein